MSSIRGCKVIEGDERLPEVMKWKGKEVGIDGEGIVGLDGRAQGENGTGEHSRGEGQRDFGDSVSVISKSAVSGGSVNVPLEMHFHYR